MAAGRSKKETIQFNQIITAGSSFTDLTALKQLIRSSCTIERIYGKFNQGQQGTLQVRPYLIHTDERAEELLTYPAGANRFMGGDNTVFDIGIDFDAYYGDYIAIDVKNISAYDYTLQISFEVDYVGGASRVI